MQIEHAFQHIQMYLPIDGTICTSIFTSVFIWILIVVLNLRKYRLEEVQVAHTREHPKIQWKCFQIEKILDGNIKTINQNSIEKPL